MNKIHKCDCNIASLDISSNKFCGVCQECGNQGHVAYFPYKGEWCNKCYIIIKKTNLKRIATKYKYTQY